MIVTVEQRNSIDAKTFGGVYMEMIDKMKDITLIEALSRIMVLAFREIRELADISEIIISQIFILPRLARYEAGGIIISEGIGIKELSIAIRIPTPQ